jgi:hypothetical protein
MVIGAIVASALMLEIEWEALIERVAGERAHDST